MTKHTIREWEHIKGVKILDPDGFDRKDPKLYDRKFTEAEFNEGMMMSTVSRQPIMQPKDQPVDELRDKIHTILRSVLRDDDPYLQPTEDVLVELCQAECNRARITELQWVLDTCDNLGGDIRYSDVDERLQQLMKGQS